MPILQGNKNVIWSQQTTLTEISENFKGKREKREINILVKQYVFGFLWLFVRLKKRNLSLFTLYYMQSIFCITKWYISSVKKCLSSTIDVQDTMIRISVKKKNKTWPFDEVRLDTHYVCYKYLDTQIYLLLVFSLSLNNTILKLESLSTTIEYLVFVGDCTNFLTLKSFHL